MRIPCSAAGSAQGEILGWGDPSPPNILIYQILKCLSNWSIAEYQISKVLLVYIRKQMTYSASLKLKGLMTRHWFQRISTRKAQDHCQPGVLCLYLFLSLYSLYRVQRNCRPGKAGPAVSRSEDETLPLLCIACVIIMESCSQGSIQEI